MTDITLELAAGEKLFYTFDFSTVFDGGIHIDGSPVVTITPASPALTLVSTTATDTAVTVVLSHATAAAGVEWAVECAVNTNHANNYDYKLGAVVRSKTYPAAATNGLTTVARVIAELGVTDAAQIDLLADYINEATAAISTYCKRAFHREAGIVETLAGYGTNYLMPSRTPIASVASIAFDGQTVPAADYSVYDGNMIYSPYGWEDTAKARNTVAQMPIPNSNERLYTVTYTGGYILPGVSGRTLPYDIERACIEMVKHLLYSRRRDSTIKSEDVDGVYSVTYADNTGEGGSLPATVERMIAPYRRRTL